MAESHQPQPLPKHQPNWLSVQLEPDASQQDKLDAVFAIMPGFFPAQWSKNYGIEDTSGAWGQCVAGLKPEAIMAGLRELARNSPAYLPNPGTFAAWCRAARAAELRQQVDAPDRLPAPKPAGIQAILEYASMRYFRRCTGTSFATWTRDEPEGAEDINSLIEAAALPLDGTDNASVEVAWEAMRRDVRRVFGARGW